ncbi:MAG: ABC transporter ATP-binding protein [Lachnospiraceae bacterium]|nr:ABC transporter ATP-binding protein [Lachnospiraceae bacterium]
MGRVKGKETEFQKDVRSHFRAIRLLFTYSREWSVYGITLIMDGLYPFISIYVSARLLDALYEKRPFEEMIFWALLGAGMAFLVTTVRHVAAKYKNTLWWSMRFRMEEPMMEKAIGMDYELMEDEEVQKLRARQAEYRKYGGSAFEIFIWQMELFLTACLKLVFAIVTVAALPGAASRGGRMAGIATVAVLSAGLFWMQRTARRAGEREYRLWRKSADRERLDTFMMSEVVLDAEAGKDIRLFHQQDMLLKYGRRMCENSRKVYQEISKIRMGQGFLQSLWAAVLGAAAYLYTGMQAYGGAIAPGSVVRYAGGIQQMVQAVTDLLYSWDYLHNNREKMTEFFAYLDLPEKKKKGTIPVQKRRDGRFLIEFKNVSFRYPGTETWVLKDMNLRFEIGERVALVGPNGSGKTTFVKLLCRLYDPTEGVILMNEVDIRKYRYEEYMRLFSVVFQDFQVFSLKMGEYIAGRADVDEQRALDAVGRAYGALIQNAAGTGHHDRPGFFGERICGFRRGGPEACHSPGHL